jgi:plastocyanin
MMKKALILVLPLLLVLAVASAGCGKSAGGSGGCYSSPEVTMGQVDFDKHCLTITAGTTVKWVDPTSASTHILCVGENGTCQSGAEGPANLTSGSGMQIDPGQTKESVFDKPGTFKIACTVHPNMNMTITVQ